MSKKQSYRLTLSERNIPEFEYAEDLALWIFDNGGDGVITSIHNDGIADSTTARPRGDNRPMAERMDWSVFVWGYNSFKHEFLQAVEMGKFPGYEIVETLSEGASAKIWLRGGKL